MDVDVDVDVDVMLLLMLMLLCVQIVDDYVRVTEQTAEQQKREIQEW